MNLSEKAQAARDQHQHSRLSQPDEIFLDF